MPMPPTKDIWSRSFLHDVGDGEAGSSSDEDVLGPDAVTVDAGELERQQVEQLDLSARDEGGLVVKHNPWTKAKVAAGSRGRLDSSPVAASSDPSSSSSSSGARPAAPSSESSNWTVSAEGRPHLLSAPKATPLPAPTGSVHGRNGWWRPPPSAARPTTAKLGPADTGRPTKKRKAVSVPGEERALTAEAGERVIDLTAARLAPSQSGARQDLLRRLGRHRSHNQDLPGKSEVSVEGISPGSASPPLTSTDPSALEIQHMPSPAAHTVDRQAGTPSVDPANSSSSGVAAPSQPQPMRRMAEASLDEAILVDSSSSSPSPEAKPPHRTMNSQLAHRPSSPRVPEKTTSAAAAAKRKASSPEAPGRITFSRIPRDAGPTADYPILRGLDLQRRNAARQPAPPVARKTKGSEQARALEAAARPAGRLVDRGPKGSAGRSSPVEERPALPPPALQYHLPPSAVAGSPFAEGADGFRAPLSRPSQPTSTALRPATLPSFAPFNRPSAYDHPSFGKALPPLSERWSTLPAPSGRRPPPLPSPTPAMAREGLLLRGPFRLPAPALAARAERRAAAAAEAEAHVGPSSATVDLASDAASTTPAAVAVEPAVRPSVAAAAAAAAGRRRRVTLWRPDPPARPTEGGSSSSSSDDDGGRSLRLVGPRGQPLVRPPKPG